MSEQQDQVQEDEFDVWADVAGIWEVALDLGVTIYRVQRWIERRRTTGCPRPVRKLHMGYLYSLAEWRAWFALWRLTRGSETWNRKPSDAKKPGAG